MIKQAFTLLELIVVIIIIGVLATLGTVNFSRMIEGSRYAEARIVIAQMRKDAAGYYAQNSTLTGMPPEALGLGADIPYEAWGGTCQPTHYFIYGYLVLGSSSVRLVALRCCDGQGNGKPPNLPAGQWRQRGTSLETDLVTGVDTWYSSDY